MTERDADATSGHSLKLCRRHKQYRMSCAAFDQLEQRSGGKCERCGVDGREVHRGLVIDHEHRLGPGAVRGLLCWRCNSILRFVDFAVTEPDVLTVAYLAISGFPVLAPRRGPVERPRSPKQRTVSGSTSRSTPGKTRLTFNLPDDLARFARERAGRNLSAWFIDLIERTLVDQGRISR